MDFDIVTTFWKTYHLYTREIIKIEYLIAPLWTVALGHWSIKFISGILVIDIFINCSHFRNIRLLY